MDKRDQIKQRKIELIHKLEESRTYMTGAKALLKDQADVKKHVVQMVSGNPKKTFLGALAAGLVGSVALKAVSKKKAKSSVSGKKKKGVKGKLFGIVLSVLVKRVKKIAAQKVKSKIFSKA